MQLLASGFDFFHFFNRVQHAAVRLLMLDYDGTLAPFHVRPERAPPYPPSRVVSALDEIARDGRTRIVIVSGRRAAEIEPLLTLRSMPEIWGAHGWERRLVVVSNRLPFGFEQDGAGGWRSKRGSGGLVSALLPVLRDRGGLWIGWPGIADGGDALDAAVKGAGLDSGFNLEAVRLDAEEVRGFYEGMGSFGLCFTICSPCVISSPHTGTPISA
jgi:hypothetical protein